LIITCNNIGSSVAKKQTTLMQDVNKRGYIYTYMYNNTYNFGCTGWHVDLNSQTRDGTHTPCSESVES